MNVLKKKFRCCDVPIRTEIRIMWAMLFLVNLTPWPATAPPLTSQPKKKTPGEAEEDMRETASNWVLFSVQQGENSDQPQKGFNLLQEWQRGERWPDISGTIIPMMAWVEIVVPSSGARGTAQCCWTQVAPSAWSAPKWWKGWDWG